LRILASIWEVEREKVVQWQNAATNCNILQRTTTYCNALHHSAAHCITLQRRGAEWCSVLQYIAVCCSTLQYVAAHYTMLQHIALCCSTLQYAAVHCSMLQYIAVRCSFLFNHGAREIETQHDILCTVTADFSNVMVWGPMIHRLYKKIVLFCKRDLWKTRYFAKGMRPYGR